MHFISCFLLILLSDIPTKQQIFMACSLARVSGTQVVKVPNRNSTEEFRRSLQINAFFEDINPFHLCEMRMA